MTPQEVHDYKMNWMPGYSIPVHSDKAMAAKDWCKANLEQHQWRLKTYTDVYEHTFYFERKSNAKEFGLKFAQRYEFKKGESL